MRVEISKLGDLTRLNRLLADPLYSTSLNLVTFAPVLMKTAASQIEIALKKPGLKVVVWNKAFLLVGKANDRAEVLELTTLALKLALTLGFSSSKSSELIISRLAAQQ